MRNGWMMGAIGLIGLLTLTGCRSDSVKQPTVRGEGRARRLVLPEAMAEALRVYDTRYRLCTDEDFARSATGAYKYAAGRAPFAVVTDFDADGRMDVVMVGRSPGYTSTLAILSGPGGCRVVELSRAKLPMNAKTLPRWVSEKGCDGAADAKTTCTPGFVELDETCAVEYTYENGRFRNRVVNS